MGILKESIEGTDAEKAIVRIQYLLMFLTGAGVFLAGVYFYWGEIRPSNIIKECTAEVRLSPHNAGNFNQGEYNNCLRRMGIEP